MLLDSRGADGPPTVARRAPSSQRDPRGDGGRTPSPSAGGSSVRARARALSAVQPGQVILGGMLWLLPSRAPDDDELVERSVEAETSAEAIEKLRTEIPGIKISSVRRDEY
jgi:hypothetical protein